MGPTRRACAAGSAGEDIWSDLLLATLWDRVLDARAQRMLFRMTLLRRPWDDGLLPYLADPEDDADVARRTAGTLSGTSLLEQVNLTVANRAGRSRRPFYTVHAVTSVFVKRRFLDARDLIVETHRRVGTHLEEQASLSTDLSISLEAGYHLFEAVEYDRAFALLGAAWQTLGRWGRAREGLQILLPFLAPRVQCRMTRIMVGRLVGTIGNAYVALGEPQSAIAQFEQALVISREIGDRRGEGITLSNLGNAYTSLGDARRAIEQYQQALVLLSKVGERHAEGLTLGNLGVSFAALGEFRRAIDFHEQNLAIVREVGDRQAEGAALGNLGIAYTALGEPRRAIQYCKEALVIAQEIGHKRGEGSNLGSLGNAYGALGELRRAIEHHELALVIFRKIGDRSAEGRTLGNVGNAYVTLGEIRQRVRMLPNSRW